MAESQTLQLAHVRRRRLRVRGQRSKTKASKAEIMRRLPLCAMTTTHKPARGKAHALADEALVRMLRPPPQL